MGLYEQLDGEQEPATGVTPQAVIQESREELRASRGRWRLVALGLLTSWGLVAGGFVAAVALWPTEEVYVPHREALNESGHHIMADFGADPDACPDTESIDVFVGVTDPLFCAILGGIPNHSLILVEGIDPFVISCAAERRPHKTHCGAKPAEVKEYDEWG